jgi:ribosomal protein S17E
LEDIAKTYAAPAATAWFKVTNNRKPTKEEYNKKVVEFIKKFENLIKSCYPENDEYANNLRDYISKNVRNVISPINSGNNKEVERRYRYYVDYN